MREVIYNDSWQPDVDIHHSRPSWTTSTPGKLMHYHVDISVMRPFLTEHQGEQCDAIMMHHRDLKPIMKSATETTPKHCHITKSIVLKGPAAL